MPNQGSGKVRKLYGEGKGRFTSGGDQIGCIAGTEKEEDARSQDLALWITSWCAPPWESQLASPAPGIP